MAATQRGERELKQTAARDLRTGINSKTGQPLTAMERLRKQCLSRGSNGIRGFSRVFKIMDDDGDKQLSFPEFTKGLRDYGVVLESRDLEQQAFEECDTDGSGSIQFDELLEKLRPPMSRCRRDMINKAFRKFDADGSGTVTIEDLKQCGYSVKHHKDYINGNKTEEELLTTFLEKFEEKGDRDGSVTLQEFTDYYAGVSASIDQDAYFTLMMTQAWKL